MFNKLALSKGKVGCSLGPLTFRGPLKSLNGNVPTQTALALRHVIHGTEPR